MDQVEAGERVLSTIAAVRQCERHLLELGTGPRLEHLRTLIAYLVVYALIHSVSFRVAMEVNSER